MSDYKRLTVFLARKAKSGTYLDILRLINELESENEILKINTHETENLSFQINQMNGNLIIENQKLKNRIAELEKENKSKTDTITDLLKNQEFYETEKLKQFAERLKKRLNLGLYKWQYAEVDSKTIDEILKEYIDEE